jgi:hypothetical protein
MIAGSDAARTVAPSRGAGAPPAEARLLTKERTWAVRS